MKTLEELARIREKMQDKIGLRNGVNSIRVVVGMGTCGIAAGARPVLNTLVEEVAAQGLSSTATVTQSGCMSNCQYEPMVEVYENDKEKVTYVNVTPDMAKRIVVEHIKNGKPVAEYTLENKN